MNAVAIESPKRFYVVCLSPVKPGFCTIPKVAHATVDEAVKEAKRLATISKQSFGVTEICHLVIPEIFCTVHRV